MIGYVLIVWLICLMALIVRFLPIVLTLSVILVLGVWHGSKHAKCREFGKCSFAWLVFPFLLPFWDG